MADGSMVELYPEDFEYYTLELEDRASSNILSHLHRAADFIHGALAQGQAHVFVHCNQGRSRSATVLGAYFIKYHALSAKAAIEHMRKCGRPVKPNRGFLRQLQEFENSHSGK